MISTPNAKITNEPIQPQSSFAPWMKSLLIGLLVSGVVMMLTRRMDWPVFLLLLPFLNWRKKRNRVHRLWTE